MAPQKKEDKLNDYVETILQDQNEINEETALQLELINQSIAQLNSDQKLKIRTKIGFATKEQERND